MRYLPIFAGMILATAFALSVLTDGGDVARAAWKTGEELLGMFGGFGLVALPAIFVASAFARRGVAKRILATRPQAKGVDLLLEGERRVHLAAARVRGGFVDDLDSGRVRVSLELAGGVTDGDRIVIEAERHEAAPFLGLIGPAPRFELGAEGWRWGAALSAVSIVAGASLGELVFERVKHAAQLAGVDGASGAGFSLGMIVAAIGFVRGALAVAMAAREVTVGIDGIRIEGAIRKRFIAFEEIHSAQADTFGVVLDLEDGERLRLGSPGVEPARARTLAALISERLTEAAPSSPRVPIALGDGEVRAWRQAIEDTTRGAGYRGNAESSEALSDSLAAPGLSPEERVATAIALLARGEEPERIRVAAASVADESTKAALERLAEGEADDEALETLLVRRGPTGPRRAAS